MHDIRAYPALRRISRRLAAGGIAVAGWCIPSVWAGEQLAGPVPATVEQVVDGDTLAVRAQIWLGQQVRVHVRLVGIDAPEIKGRCAEERALAVVAQRFVEDFILSSTADIGSASAKSSVRIWLSDISEGKYAGRVLARVVNAAGDDLGNALVGAGFARPYAGGVRQNWCAAGPEK